MNNISGGTELIIISEDFFGNGYSKWINILGLIFPKTYNEGA